MPITYGASFLEGQTFPEDGIFFRVTTQAPPPAGVVPQGIAAVLMRASWGPLGSDPIASGGGPQALNLPNDIDVMYGIAGSGTTDLLREAFNGGALTVVAYRLGTGGARASFTLNLTAGGAAINIPLRYVGARGSGFSVLLRDSLVDTTQRELVVYEGVTQRADVMFAKAPSTAGGAGEAGALMRAVNASNSPWLGTATLVGTPGDNSTLATLSVATPPTTPGADPTVTGSDFTAAQPVLANYAFNTLAADTTDLPTIQALQTYTDVQASLGKRFMLVAGEATVDPRATRLTNARAFNDFRLVFVGNGFTSFSGNRDGAMAAARTAGQIASLEIGDGLTGLAISGATGILDPFDLQAYRTAILAGMLVFVTGPTGQVTYGEGVTTYLTPDSNHTPSFGYIVVVRTYDALMDRIYAAWNPLLRRIKNNPRGRRLLLQAANTVLLALLGSEALLSASIIEDPQRAPQGRQAWFRLMAFATQPLEQAYVTLLVDFTPTTTTPTGTAVVVAG